MPASLARLRLDLDARPVLDDAHGEKPGAPHVVVVRGRAQHVEHAARLVRGNVSEYRYGALRLS